MVRTPAACLSVLTTTQTPLRRVLALTRAWPVILLAAALAALPAAALGQSATVYSASASNSDVWLVGFDPPSVAEVNTDFRMYHTDFNREKLPDIIKRYGDGVEQQFAGDEGRFTIASLMPDVTVADIESEFGLIPLREYLDGASRIRETRLGSS